MAIETPALAGSVVLRARSDAEGNFSFFLPSTQSYHLALFDPVTGLIAHGRGTTARSGGSISLSDDLVFSASTANDGDGDGLPDDVEFAIGTGQNRADTDGDGLSDFAEIVLESDPLGGLGAPTGVVAAASFSGTAQEVDVEGSVADPTALKAYVATGTGGLADRRRRPAHRAGGARRSRSGGRE